MSTSLTLEVNAPASTLPAGPDGRAFRAWVAQAAERPPETAPDAVSFEIVRSRLGFDGLEQDWNNLCEAAGRGPHMFLTFNWLWHWANHYLPASTELAIVTGRRNGKLVLVWPMLIERVASLRQLAFMGAPVSQYGDLIIADASDRAELIENSWAFLLAAAKPDLVRLGKVRADANIAPHLQSLGFVTTSTEDAPVAMMPASASYADFEQTISAKFRKNRRRQMRRLEERGPVEMKTFAPSADAASAARAAMTLKRAWLNSRGLVSRAFADTRIDDFFADAAASADRPCGVTVSQLLSNGECADAAVSVTYKGHRALHILAYALKFEKFGVGHLHLEKALQDACADGIAAYDFLAPRHDYKLEWAEGCVTVSDYALALSPLGKIYTDVYLARVREGMKLALKKLPRGMTRFLAGAHRRASGASD